MLFDASTPDTSAYMIAGYSIFFVLSAVYLLSIFVRTRNLHRDLTTLESLQSEQEQEKQEKPAVAATKLPAASRPKAKTKTAAAKTSKARKTQKKTVTKK